MASAADEDVAVLVGRSWGGVFALGLTSLILGIVALVWTEKTLEILGVLFLIYLIVFGIVRIVQALFVSGPAAQEC